MTKITTADTDYGLALNGGLVGSGYDVEIRRSGQDSALVLVTILNCGDEWMREVEIESGTDLQALAVEIGNCPELWMEGWIHNQSEEWSELAEKWDAIEVRP